MQPRKVVPHKAFFILISVKDGQLTVLIIFTSFSERPSTLTVAVDFISSRKSVGTLKLFATSTTYYVDGIGIPISRAFTLERVMPSFFARSDCGNPFCFRRDFILSATIFIHFVFPEYCF